MHKDETPEVDVGPLPAGLGATDRILPATQYQQGGRTQQDVVLSVYEITQTVVRPDHTKPVALNRKIELPRARAFANYLLTKEDWGSPSVIVRVRPGVLRFESVQQFGHATWGWLRIPLTQLVALLLLDGQHRVLGCFLAVEELESEVTRYQDLIAKARDQGNLDLVANLRRKLKEVEDTRTRLLAESITVQFVETDEDHAKRLFVDINDNVKGVRPDFRTILNDRDIINVVAVDLIETHPLLKGRVESGQSTAFGPANENLVGAKTVADIVRAIAVGPLGRVGKVKEQEIRNSSAQLTREVSTFFDILMNRTVALAKVADGRLEPKDLRYDAKRPGPHATLLGSATMLRVLAGVYFDLTTGASGRPMNRSEVGKFIEDIEPLMEAIPMNPDEPTGKLWMSTKAFVPDAAAPGARQGQVRSLVTALCGWARNGIPDPSEVDVESQDEAV
jgi:hypothetical protein